jgi:tRNA dimethylallyltransferase
MKTPKAAEGKISFNGRESTSVSADTPRTAIVITGPTAAGKTALSLEVAAFFHTAVISADSRQCYREMTIGTAKPSPDELSRVPHYFINSHSVTAEVHAGLYEKLSLEYAARVFADAATVVVCGGTGLYLKAFCEGLDAMPAVPSATRLKVRSLYNEQGIEGLRRELAARDPAFLRQADPRNPHRLMRALEVWEASGSSILGFRNKQKEPRDFRVIKIGLGLPREELGHRIEARTDRMMEAGLVDEVQRLLPWREKNALQTVGYREIFAYLDGRCTLGQAVEEIRVHTRRYAKRQMTWFRKDPLIHWFAPGDTEKIMDFLKRETGNFG